MNKRKNRRVNCLVPIEGKEGGVFAHSQTVDFSKGGIGLISSKRIRKNKQIAIELDLEEQGNPVLVIGKVLWVKPIKKSSLFRIGLSFDDVLRGSKSRLNKYFSTRKAVSYAT